MRVVATVIALVLLASNVYGDRESVGGGDNKLMRDLDVCIAEAPMIGCKDTTMKGPMTICRCMTNRGYRFYWSTRHLVRILLGSFFTIRF
jgi:hypothetical protein